jgi:hypothetical protein
VLPTLGGVAVALSGFLRDCKAMQRVQLPVGRGAQRALGTFRVSAKLEILV